MIVSLRRDHGLLRARRALLAAKAAARTERAGRSKQSRPGRQINAVE
jgi:hypothetical protein